MMTSSVVVNGSCWSITN